jgi:hypothetical protein
VYVCVQSISDGNSSRSSSSNSSSMSYITAADFTVCGQNDLCSFLSTDPDSVSCVTKFLISPYCN